MLLLARSAQSLETLGACARLDSALQQLGMLSSITEARRDFLRESRTNFGIMRMNTRFVSNVTVGYCMKRTFRARVCPYSLPLRHRTKSENSEKDAEAPGEVAPLEGWVLKSGTLKRCQSAESLSGGTEAPRGEEHDVEGVSTRIEKLQVDE